jgi:hypothetical protein
LFIILDGDNPASCADLPKNVIIEPYSVIFGWKLRATLTGTTFSLAQARRDLNITGTHFPRVDFH